MYINENIKFRKISSYKDQLEKTNLWLLKFEFIFNVSYNNL
jgi:hypothetical protein